MAEEAAYRRERLDRGIKARSDTIFAISSHREILYLLLPRVLPVLALLIAPLALGTGYWGRVLFHACIYALLALSWDFLASTGLVSLGQALFFGIGSYIAGALNFYLGWPPFLTIPIATLGGGIISAALLAPVVRLRGVYFAMVTLALPLLLARVIETTEILGGTHGLTSIASFPNDWVAMYLAVLALLICLFGFRRLINEDYGLVLGGIRDDDRAVMSAGINIYWYKVQAVFISGMVGAFAGAIVAHYWKFVGMSVFALDYSIVPLAGAILGGPGTFAGAVVGTFILVPLSELLRLAGGLRVAIYSLILAACVVGLPEGVFHYIQRKYHQFERLVKV